MERITSPYKTASFWILLFVLSVISLMITGCDPLPTPSPVTASPTATDTPPTLPPTASPTVTATLIPTPGTVTLTPTSVPPSPDAVDTAILILGDISESMEACSEDSKNARIHISQFLITYLANFHATKVTGQLMIGWGTYPLPEGAEYDFKLHPAAEYVQNPGWEQELVSQLQNTASSLDFLRAFRAAAETLAAYEQSDNRQLIVITDAALRYKLSEKDEEAEIERLKTELQPLLHENNVDLHMVTLNCPPAEGDLEYTAEEFETNKNDWQLIANSDDSEEPDRIHLYGYNDEPLRANHQTADIIYKLVTLEELATLLPPKPTSQQEGWDWLRPNDGNGTGNALQRLYGPWSTPGDTTYLNLHMVFWGSGGIRVPDLLITEAMDTSRNGGWQPEVTGLFYSGDSGRKAPRSSCPAPEWSLRMNLVNQLENTPFIGFYWWSADTSPFGQKVEIDVADNSGKLNGDSGQYKLINTEAFTVTSALLNSVPDFYRCYQIDIQVADAETGEEINLSLMPKNPQGMVSDKEQYHWGLSFDGSQIPSRQVVITSIITNEVDERIMHQEMMTLTLEYRPEFLAGGAALEHRETCNSLCTDLLLEIPVRFVSEQYYRDEPGPRPTLYLLSSKHRLQQDQLVDCINESLPRINDDLLFRQGTDLFYALLLEELEEEEKKPWDWELSPLESGKQIVVVQLSEQLITACAYEYLLIWWLDPAGAENEADWLPILCRFAQQDEHIQGINCAQQELSHIKPES